MNTRLFMHSQQSMEGNTQEVKKHSTPIVAIDLFIINTGVRVNHVPISWLPDQRQIEPRVKKNVTLLATRGHDILKIMCRYRYRGQIPSTTNAINISRWFNPMKCIV
eukprot:GHVU01162649.1.p2 GENE.GHVU01162649.1~~GHVU01162649.1.p2  ORF type:complete len:107 (+),score=4.79 GHVU01162649.1:107-427(+)